MLNQYMLVLLDVEDNTEIQSTIVFSSIDVFQKSSTIFLYQEMRNRAKIWLQGVTFTPEQRIGIFVYTFPRTSPSFLFQLPVWNGKEHLL